MFNPYIETVKLQRVVATRTTRYIANEYLFFGITSNRPGHTGPTDELRIDRDQIPAFARVLRDFEGLCVVVRDVQSAHETRTDRVRTALIALKTR